MTDPSSVPLWSGLTLAAVCDGVIDGSLTSPITGISIDTRTIAPGDLFVALRDQRDGHDFVGSAFQAGAAAALVAKTYIRRHGDGALIRVADPLKALEDAGRVARFRTDARIIAVTGSVGKTGTKEMLRQCLSAVGATHASEKSYNNHWGVPLTLAKMPISTKFGIFEIGMNHPGEIAPLARMVAPDVGIITTVEPVHLAQFTSVAEIAEAKAELFLGMREGGSAILNRDNPFFDLLSTRARERRLRIVSFGRHSSSTARLSGISMDANGSEICASLNGRMATYRLAAHGQHYAMNSLAVVAAMDAIGADLDACLPSLSKITAPAGRGARYEITLQHGKILLIDESYNANPASMTAALANLGQVSRQSYRRRVAIVGDMRELGAEADDLHRGLLTPIEAAEVDQVFACGPHMRALFDVLPPRRRGAYAKTSSELVSIVETALKPGDAIMIKGSLGTNMAPLVKTIRELSGNSA